MIDILKGTKETVLYEKMHAVKVYYNEQVEDYPLHCHNAIEIIAPVKSLYYIETNSAHITIEEGDVFVLAPGALHSLYAPKSGERLIVQIDYMLLCNLVGLESLIQMLRPFKHITYSADKELCDNLKGLLLTIYDEYNSARPFKEANIYSMFIQLFVQLGRAQINMQSIFPNMASSKQHEYYEKFMSICSFINDNCTDNISIDLLCSMAGFSKFHFCRLFKQFAGTSYYEYVLDKRVEYVERQLTNPNLSVTEIAMKSGFNSISTFNRTFKQKRMVTPTEYREIIGLQNMKGANNYE